MSRLTWRILLFFWRINAFTLRNITFQVYCHTLEMLTTRCHKNQNMFVVCLLTICVFVRQVAARAGVYDILNHLGFSEFENPRDTPLARMRCRWQQQNIQTLPFRGKFIWETTTVTELCFSEWNTFTVTQHWFLYLLMYFFIFFFTHHWLLASLFFPSNTSVVFFLMFCLLEVYVPFFWLSR